LGGARADLLVFECHGAQLSSEHNCPKISYAQSPQHLVVLRPVLMVVLKEAAPYVSLVAVADHQALKVANPEQER
jgi:hypothetical protein